MATVEMTKGGKTAYINSTAEDLARATADGWRRVDGDGGKSESDAIKLAAMGSLNGFTVSVVDALPSEGQAGVMYFIPDSDERYVYLADSKRYEKLVFNNGGGAGTSGSTSTNNYTDLANKPKIAGVTLEGNKTAADLSLATSDELATVDTSLRDAINDKANETHVHDIDSITGLQSALDAKADNTAIPTKTSTLQNDSGYITAADVNTAIAQAVATETSARKTADSALSALIGGKADTTHSHTQSDITGLETALNAKANTADLARVATSGSYNDLTGKPIIPDAVIVDSALNATSTHAIENKAVHSALEGKANATHTHDISDITGLQNALNGKADASLLQAEQNAREAEDNSLLSLINAIHSLVNTDETKLASLEAKVANRG